MKVAIIDDERDMRLSITQWLSLSGYEAESFASAEEALAKIGSNYPGVVVSDIKMPGMDGMQLLKKLMGQDLLGRQLLYRLLLGLLTTQPENLE